MVLSWQMNWPAGSQMSSLGILVWMVGKLDSLGLHLLMGVAAKSLQQSLIQPALCQFGSFKKTTWD